MNESEKELVNYNIYRFIDKNDSRNKPGSVIKSKFPRLVKRNQSNILSLINQHKNHIKFVELINNRDYYDKKAQQYLNDLDIGNGNVGPNFNGDGAVRPPPASASASASALALALASASREPTLIDPRFITNRYHAEQYIINNVLSNANKANKLKQLMETHFSLSDQWVKDRELIVEKYIHDINSLQSEVDRLNHTEGSGKLTNTKIQILQQKLQEVENKKDDELSQYDESISFQSKKLSFESSALLKELSLPFFNTAQVYKYPTLVQDQEYLIQFIVKQLQKSASN